MGVKTSVHVDLAGVKKKFGKQSMNLGRMAMANQALADMNQFVPWMTTALRQTGHVVNKGQQIHWRTPYAKAMFHGSRPFRRGSSQWVIIRNYKKAGTGSRWDSKAKSRYGQDWARTFKRGSLL